MGSSTWEKCPVYPTELVFALDQSSGITERRFNETRDIISSIVSDLNIRENNCPVGARVAVVSYDSDTSYLIRGSDYRNKKHLLQLLSQIKYQVPQKARDIGNAMRFVARNVFKRTSSGTNFDDTGTFQVIPVPPVGNYEPLERLRRCTLCYENSRKKRKVKTEFEFTTYNHRSIMKDYIHTSLQQLNGDATIGLGLQWAMEGLFPGTLNPRKHKVIIVISAGENHEEKEFVKTMALRAKSAVHVFGTLFS
ncbi:hypothetical protein A6R68_14450 [Neotoma lepida]|uniref:VWFA domain-containing protein n=1 Tax=Neotoma lepida TaxID=56216 RepID=A0A1A6HBP2_NEOLE|nr:hypothetical protein A6R68_14450 [Neotoma lepida]